MESIMNRGIAFFPGLGGSRLTYRFLGVADVPLWISGDLLLLGIGTMALAPDGTSPGPNGLDLNAQGVTLGYYGDLFRTLQNADLTCLVLAYDWRKSILDSLPFLAGRMADFAAGHDRLTAIGHSQGGLVARALYGQCSAE